MRKIILYILVSSIVLSGLQASATFQTKTNFPQQKNSMLSTTYEDELDQSMTEFEGVLPVGRYSINPGQFLNISVAQSFIPQKEVLTRIQLYMAKNSTTTQPCSITLRDSLQGTTIATASLDASSFINYGPEIKQLEWVEFDIPDLWVDTAETYYIVIYTSNVTNNNYWIGGNSTNQYPDGSAYLSMNDGASWEEFMDADGCFKTYELKETFLSVDFEPSSFPNPYSSGTWRIKNIGNATAWDIVGTITITGEIFSRINKTIISTLDRLDVGQETILSFSNGLIFGFGPITLKLSLYAANVRESSITKQGTIILFFIIIH